MNTVQRFWAKVDKSGDCWIWTASKRNKGYGAFCYQRGDSVVQGRAHRYSYEIHIGPIPAGLCVLHTCDTPACVKPDHLWLGSKAENNADMCAKGRHVPGNTHLREKKRVGKYKRGVEHHAAKLTPEIVREIRSRQNSGASYGYLAREYCLSIGYVWRLIHRATWKEINNGTE